MSMDAIICGNTTRSQKGAQKIKLNVNYPYAVKTVCKELAANKCNTSVQFVCKNLVVGSDILTSLIVPKPNR